jgi:hypothetical protein
MFPFADNISRLAEKMEKKQLLLDFGGWIQVSF